MRYREELLDHFRDKVHKTQFELSMGSTGMEAAAYHLLVKFAAHGVAAAVCNDRHYRKVAVDTLGRVKAMIDDMKGTQLEGQLPWHYAVCLGAIFETALAAYSKVHSDG